MLHASLLNASRLAPEPDSARRRVRLDVADADVPAGDAQLAGDALALAGEDDPRLAAGFLGDLHVGPRDAAAPAGAEHLQHRFLGGEPPGEVLEVTLGVLRAIRLIRPRED